MKLVKVTCTGCVFVKSGLFDVLYTRFHSVFVCARQRLRLCVCVLLALEVYASARGQSSQCILRAQAKPLPQEPMRLAPGA